MPVIVGGVFNDEPDRDLIRKMISKNFCDLYSLKSNQPILSTTISYPSFTTS